MVVVFAVFSARLGIEEIVARYEFKNLFMPRWISIVTGNPNDEAYHGCHAPNVSAGTPFGPENNFGRSILSGLNVVGKMMAYPACIAQVGNLDGDGIHCRCDVLLKFLWRSTFVERNSRYVLSEDVPVAYQSIFWVSPPYLVLALRSLFPLPLDIFPTATSMLLDT